MPAPLHRRTRAASRKCLAVACASVAIPAIALATPSVTTNSTSYVVNNGATSFTLNYAGSNAGKVSSIVYDGHTLVLVRAADGHVWLQQNIGALEVATVSNEEDVAQSLNILLATSLGERVMQPEYGCNLNDYMFESLTVP